MPFDGPEMPQCIAKEPGCADSLVSCLPLALAEAKLRS
jgi:hypothetical protein